MLRRAAVLSMIVGSCLASTASAQVKLEYKFKEGTSTTQKATVKYQQVLSINGMDMESETDLESNSTQSIGKRAADGALPILNKLNSVKLHVTAGGQTYDIDTADANAKFDLPQLEAAHKILKAVVEAPYTILLDDKNQFKSVDGVDKLLEKLKDDPMAADQLKARLTDEIQKREFDDEHGNLPKVLARKGETWEATEHDDLGGGQSLTFRRRYEYLGTKEKDGRTLDEIGITALDVTYALAANSALPVKVTKSDLKIESSMGSMLFDREEGQVVERKTDDKIKGDMTLNANDMELPSKLDLTVSQSSITEPAKKVK